MNKSRIWIIFMIALMSLPLIVACSGDDENGSSNVGGINVTDGKRLIQIGDPAGIKVEYDTKGRISRILVNEGDTYGNTNFREIALIDYDLRVLRVFDSYGSKRSDSFGFVLNENGYISQIGTCTMQYDSKGYLIGVEEPRGLSSLAYDGNDLIKASVTTFRKGKIYLYYVTYGNDDNQGDLYVKIRYAEQELSEILKYPSYVGLIAYQAGLFGKVAKSFIQLKNKDKTNSVFEIINESNSKDSYTFKMTFIYE